LKELELILQGFTIELTKITLAINELKAETQKKSKHEDLPEWINIDLAIKLKGGCSAQWIKNNLFLQPCCGINFKSIGGRKCWQKDDVIFWLTVTDSDLKGYAEKWKTTIPENYQKRSA
jgi:hypothetical protein